MTCKNIHQWIRSNGWPRQMDDKVAIKYFHGHSSHHSSQTLTHAQVSSLANQICQHIESLNVRHQLIVIDAEETLFTASLLVGILQSNNSVFIADSNLPETVLKTHLIRLQPSLFILEGRHRMTKAYDQLLCHASRSSLVLLENRIDFYAMPSASLYEDIAYVVASSGSTGIPKLIYVSHACILPNLQQLKSVFDVTSDDCLFRSTPLTFDPFFIDVFLALHCGASLCILSQETRRNSIVTSTAFTESQCTIAQMTPSSFRQLSTQCNLLQLKTLVLGGEAFPVLLNTTLQQMLKQGKRLVNIYGLTEMSCWAFYHILNENDLQRTDGIPLGKPLDETSFRLNPCLDDPHRKDCFRIILDSTTRWTRLEHISAEKQFTFDTDDLVRWDQQSEELFFIGRRTWTRKRFGVMINLEYIEQIADQSDLLSECACLISHEDDNFLVLLCKFKQESEVDELDSFLRSHLPHHFLPNLILPLEQPLPLNANGKIDRTLLPSLYRSTMERSSTNTLTEMWQILLGKDPSADSNFLVVGGNSLLALTLTERIKRRYRFVDFNLVFDLILHRTYEDLINYVNHPRVSDEKDEPVSSIPSTITSTIPLHLPPIRSIQRCSKLTLHTQDHLVSEQSPCLTEWFPSTFQLKLHWKASLKKCIDGSPLVVLLDDRRQYVIVGSHAGLVNAYQLDTGELTWSFQANDRIEASATLSRNGQWVIIGDYSGMLYIIDSCNGQLYSTYQCGDTIKTTVSVHSSIDLIYLGSHDQMIHAVQIKEKSCTSIWQYRLNGSCVSSPQLSNDNHRLYIASLSGDVFAFHSTDGCRLWKQSLNKPVFSTMAVWHDQLLLIGCVDQSLYALNCDNGEQKWAFSADGPIFSSPCLINDHVYFGCHDRYLYALDLTNGAEAVLLWKSLFPSMIYGSPFVFDKDRLIVVGSTDGCLRVLLAQTGHILCETLMSASGLFSSPICYRDFVLVGSRDDHLYCYKLLP